MLFKLVVLTICSSQLLDFLCGMVSEKFEHGWIMTSHNERSSTKSSQKAFAVVAMMSNGG